MNILLSFGASLKLHFAIFNAVDGSPNPIMIVRNSCMDVWISVNRPILVNSLDTARQAYPLAHGMPQLTTATTFPSYVNGEPLKHFLDVLAVKPKINLF